MLTMTNDQMDQIADGQGGQPIVMGCDLGKTWIAIRLIDDDDKPVPRERYRLRLPDFSLIEGMLDEAGEARHDGLDPGTCQVCFPDIDAREWRPA